MSDRPWTKPYYGVSHLAYSRKGFQVTIIDGRMTEGYILNLNADDCLTNPVFETMGQDYNLVKGQLEQRAKELGISQYLQTFRDKSGEMKGVIK